MQQNQNEKNRNTNKDTVFAQSKWHIGNVFHYLDSFGSPMPTFNLKGKDKVTTIAGGLLTALILTLTMAYAIQKLFAIYEKSDPTINLNTVTKYYS